MNRRPTKILALILAASAVVGSARFGFAAKASSKEARVTQIFHEVKLLPAEADPRVAEVNDRVPEDTGVRTGDRSRSELTFTDLTIERLGANTIFSFNKGGRSVDLGGGSILLRVPKDSGGANIKSPAVSVAVTGTTLILEAARGGRSKLIVLEGAARLRLTSNPSQIRTVQAGQMLDVPAGATTLPDPTKIDLNQVMNSHPLIVGFPPLPSRNLINAAENRPNPNEPVYQGQPVSGGGPNITGGFGGSGFIPPGLFGGNSGGGRGNVGNPGNSDTPGRPAGNGKGSSVQGKATKSQPTPKPRNPNNPNGPG